MTNAKIGVTYIAVIPEIEAEKTADHLRRMREEFDNYFRTRDYGMMKAFMEQAERWYPNHEITLGMRSDYDFEFND